MIFYFYIFYSIFAQRESEEESGKECFELNCHPTSATIKLKENCQFLSQIREGSNGEWETFFYLGSIDDNSVITDRCSFKKSQKELFISYDECGFIQNIETNKLIYQIQVYYGNNFLGRFEYIIDNRK